MAKLWKPPLDKIGSNERIGRRLFDEPNLAGAADQRPANRLELHHFEERRDGGTSVDRLGATGPDKRVKAYLVPRAQYAGSKFVKPKQFDGWAIVPAKELLSARKKPAYMIHPSSVAGEDLEEMELNTFHAHIDRPPEVHNTYLMALQLRDIFEKHGGIEPVERVQSSLKKFLANIFTNLRRMLSRRDV